MLTPTAAQWSALEDVVIQWSLPNNVAPLTSRAKWWQYTYMSRATVFSRHNIAVICCEATASPSRQFSRRMEKSILILLTFGTTRKTTKQITWAIKRPRAGRIKWTRTRIVHSNQITIVRMTVFIAPAKEAKSVSFFVYWSQNRSGTQIFSLSRARVMLNISSFLKEMFFHIFKLGNFYYNTHHHLLGIRMTIVSF